MMLTMLTAKTNNSIIFSINIIIIDNSVVLRCAE